MAFQSWPRSFSKIPARAERLRSRTGGSAVPLRRSPQLLEPPGFFSRTIPELARERPGGRWREFLWEKCLARGRFPIHPRFKVVPLPGGP